MKLSIVLAFGACFGRLHLTSNSNLVVYWGQNSYGHTHLRSPTDWEKPLRHYCEDESISTLIISFLYKLRAGSGRLPILNLSKHCVTHFEAPNHDLLKCPEVEQDIKYCQQRGKTILLSIGGDVGLTNIPTPAAADQLAIDIWNLYLGGHSDYRPFGSAKLDGIDLDIEGAARPTTLSSWLN
ncbi:Chitinase 2, partial [Massospora cicadina]